MNIDNQLVVINTPKNNKFLAVVDMKKEFTTNEGNFKFSQINNIPTLVKTSTGINFKIYKPTYKEFVLLMKRGPQIIYPKDVAQIVLESNIHNSSKVLEIGSGSGALTLYLYTLLKNTGVLYSLDSSRINQRRADKTISRYISTLSDENKDITFINEELINFVKKSDVLIYDSTYEDEEFKNYIGWGHSTWQEGVRLANQSDVKKYYIFHHNPDNTDSQMKKIEKKSKLMGKNIIVAKEGMCVKI